MKIEARSKGQILQVDFDPETREEETVLIAFKEVFARYCYQLNTFANFVDKTLILTFCLTETKK